MDLGVDKGLDELRVGVRLHMGETMFKIAKSTKEASFSSGLRLGDNFYCVAALVVNNRLQIKSFAICPWNEVSGLEKAYKASFSLILSPEDTFIGAIPLPVGVSEKDLPEAAKWAFAKESDIDMSNVEIEIQKVFGSESGGSLLRDSVWVFGVEKPKLKAVLGSLVGCKFDVGCVDLLASAQRNLAWAESEAMGDQSGAIASLVVGRDFSALGIVSNKGDLLFHKQLEWTTTLMESGDLIDKVIIDVQRNIGFFERRLGSVNVSSGYVFCDNGLSLAGKLNEVWGDMTWKSAKYEWISEGADCGIAAICPWLLGELVRWVDEK